MQLPQIQIQTTDIQMDYQTRQPFQKIEQSQADISILQPAAIVEINTTNAKLDINMDQMWRDLGIISTGESISEYAQKGKQAVLQNISRTVGEGRQMLLGAGKDQGASTLQNIAKQNHGPKRAGPYNIKFIPSIGSVDVNVIPGKVDVNIQRRSPKIDVQVNKPRMDFTYGDVRGTMIARPDVEIDVIG